MDGPASQPGFGKPLRPASPCSAASSPTLCVSADIWTPNAAPGDRPLPRRARQNPVAARRQNHPLALPPVDLFEDIADPGGLAATDLRRDEDRPAADGDHRQPALALPHSRRVWPGASSLMPHPSPTSAPTARAELQRWPAGLLIRGKDLQTAGAERITTTDASWQPPRSRALDLQFHEIVLDLTSVLHRPSSLNRTTRPRPR